MPILLNTCWYLSLQFQWKGVIVIVVIVGVIVRYKSIFIFFKPMRTPQSQHYCFLVLGQCWLCQLTNMWPIQYDSQLVAEAAFCIVGDLDFFLCTWLKNVALHSGGISHWVEYPLVCWSECCMELWRQTFKSMCCL